MSINTHYYDGQLRDIYAKLIAKDTSIPPSYQNTLDEIWQVAKNLFTNDADLKKIKEVLRVVHLGSKSNYDPRNDINFEDLLPRTWVHVKKYDPAEQYMFFEQLTDILGGKCAQGRTTRIMQFYVMQMVVGGS